MHMLDRPPYGDSVMFRAANEASFWDRAARKYAADPVKDVAG